MKSLLTFLIVLSSVMMVSCRARKGCPSNGKNVGAERILSGEAKALKDVKKAKKFKA